MDNNNNPIQSFPWTSFYMEFADKLLHYKDKRPELLQLIKSVYDDLGMRYPFMDHDQPIDDICPFTVFGCFNKGITTKNRIAIMQELRNKLGITSVVSTEFEGIPVLNNMRSWFFGYKADRQPEDIPNLWGVFEAAINYADNPSEVSKAGFNTFYDTVRKQLGIKWNLTVGLYWIRPFSYLNLDEPNRRYLTRDGGPYTESIAKLSNLKQAPVAKTYLDLIAACKELFKKEEHPQHSFPELSYTSWNTSGSSEPLVKKSNASFLKWFVPIINALRELGGTATPEQVRNQIITDLHLPEEVIKETRGKTETKKFDNEVAFARNYLAYEGFIDKSQRGIWSLTEKGRTEPMSDEIAGEIFLKWVDILKVRRENEPNPLLDERNPNEKRYWLFAPGNNSSQWNEFYGKGIMGVNWDEMGDLRQYPSKDAMKSKMKEIYGQEYSYMNSALATWQFANEIRQGDIVYAKKGMHAIIGRGIVESDYIFDDTRQEYKHLHRVQWTHNGEWEHPGQAAVKTLTDITAYTDYVQKLEALFIDDETADVTKREKEIVYPPYTADDFLSQVFMDEDRFNTLVHLLQTKKNIILQGPPGVGKTFAAKRLAYAVMGEKDSSRVMMVQFHQSYSYEDFIMGFRPVKDGFELTPGPFYQFCKTAQDDERDYFFIIDEINRGNLSKIFGELLMLIEKDKRGEKLRLLYSNELFTVPKNVHIIGMMNTADRSLAMIDYALRRRFAFFDLEPAFDSDGFKALLLEANHAKFNTLVEQIKAINDFIGNDESLGDGFKIGHSYFCIEPEEEVTDEWLANVLKYELLPLLNEYWFDEKAKIEQWSRKLTGALDD